MAHAAELTGNDYVSLPHIDADGSIHGITVVHGALAGLIEWSGGDEPLCRLRVTVDGVPLDLADLRWRRLDRWIPVFTLELADGSSITATYCAPGGYPAARGFLIRLDVENRGRRSLEVAAALEITWAATRLCIATSRPVPPPDTLVLDEANRALVLASSAAALAIGADTTADLSVDASGAEVRRGSVHQGATVRSNSRGSLVFLAGVGRERDGAVTALGAMRRYPADHWLRQARLELSHTLRSAQDHRWAEALNRNLLFNRFFAVGRGIDDDLLYVLRSRSPLCPQPALLNEREALLWTLPALLLADAGLAREAMFRVFELASERSGELLRYIDGGAFDFAFVLDQMLLYSWAADHYIRTTGDEAVLEDALMSHVVFETDAALFMRLHPEQLLAFTELLPSGDKADYPYSTTANALFWCFCDRLARLPRGSTGEVPPRLAGAAPEVAAAIWQHCVTDVDGAAVLVSSTDLDGAAAVYDDPSLSLALLPFFGLCTEDDPVWRSTMEFLRSARYPLWRDGRVPGLADRVHPERARTSALCADILADLADPLARLAHLQLPAGVAAGCYDVATGECGEPHHAALAGYLAWSLARAAEPPARKIATRKAKRR